MKVSGQVQIVLDDRVREVAVLRQFLRRSTMAIQCSNGQTGFPQSAVVGVATSPGFEFYFDTLEGTRKCQNLRRDPRASLVFGWDVDEGVTVQVEGFADEPEGTELAGLKAVYYSVFADGHERAAWPGLTYVRVQPVWIRYSDFAVSPPRVLEFDRARLGLEPHLAKAGTLARA